MIARLRQAAGAAGLCAAFMSAGCAGGGAPHGGGSAMARTYYYHDNSGLDVSTTAVEAERRVAERWSAGARGVFDWIRVERKPLEVEHQSGNQATGHVHADTVTSASAFVKGGEIAQKWRVEGTGSATYHGGGESPWEVKGSARFGKEPDYESASGALSMKAELFERNTTVGATLGYGHDRVMPVEAPPGQEADWPAAHDRVLGTVSVTQLLAPWVLASGGGGVTCQWGALENPYRRAIVRTSLFPERVPERRVRFVAFLGLSAQVLPQTALHFRQGFYADDWGVLAILPEISAVRSFGDRLLASLRYRFYRQTRAWFHEARYADLEPFLSGDARLGALTQHEVGAELRWTVLRGSAARGPVAIVASYDLSLVEYEGIDTDAILGHAPSLGLILSY